MTRGSSRIDTGVYFAAPFGGRPRRGRTVASFASIALRDAPHGFVADYRPSYRADAAADGWRRMQEWFKRFGAA